MGPGRVFGMGGRGRGGCQARGEVGCDFGQVGGVGAGGDYEGGEEGDLVGAVPVAEGCKGVGTDEEEELGVGWELLAEGDEGFGGVVGLAVGRRGVEQGDLKVRLVFYGEAGHGQAVFKGGVMTGGGFQGLCTDGGEEDLVEVEGLPGGAGDGEVAEVGRVKAASEEGCAHEVYGSGWECGLRAHLPGPGAPEISTHPGYGPV